MEGTVLNQIVEALVSIDRTQTLELTKKALEDGVDPTRVLNEGLLKGLLEVGEKWNNQEYFISHVLLAAQALQEANLIIEPHLVDSDSPTAGTVVIGTVEGDIHDIGKNLVTIMLKANNFKVYDLGVDVAPQKFIDKAKEVGADLVACSLIMSVALPKVEEVVQLVQDEANLTGTKVIIGGAPITQAVTDQLGADGWAPNASQAAKEALRLMEGA